MHCAMDLRDKRRHYAMGLRERERGNTGMNLREAEGTLCHGPRREIGDALCRRS